MPSASEPQGFSNPFKTDEQFGKQEQGKGASSRLQPRPGAPSATLGCHSCPGTRPGGAGHKVNTQPSSHGMPLWNAASSVLPATAIPNPRGSQRIPQPVHHPPRGTEVLKNLSAMRDSNISACHHFQEILGEKKKRGEMLEEEEEEDKWSREGGRWEPQKQGGGEAVLGAQQLKPP